MSESPDRREIGVAAVYKCRCGFASGTAVGFQRHIARYKGDLLEGARFSSSATSVLHGFSLSNCPCAGETGKHRMVSKSDAAAKAPSKPANAVDTQTTIEASQLSERSWLGSLWASGVSFIVCVTLSALIIFDIDTKGEICY